MPRSLKSISTKQFEKGDLAESDRVCANVGDGHINRGIPEGEMQKILESLRQRRRSRKSSSKAEPGSSSSSAASTTTGQRGQSGGASTTTGQQD